MSGLPPVTLVEIAQGTDTTIKCANVKVNGVLVSDFTGWTARAQIRAYKTSLLILHEWDVVDIDLTAPDILLRITAAQSDAWTFYHGYFDVEVVHPTLGVHRVGMGPVRVDPQTTRVGS